MIRKLFSRRGGVAVASTALGIAGMSVAFAGTAAAAPNASLLVGSGSQTAYSTMTLLGDLFNNSPGCDLTQSTSLPLALNCGTTGFAAGGAQGEQGFVVAAENPYNDYTVQAPAIGSGNGIKQIQQAAGSSINPAYARSSKGTGGNTQENFIAYATDGVSWTAFNKVGATKTNQAKVTNISTLNLKAIWNGTLSCTVKGHNYTQDWICLGAKHSSPIDCYVAQTGSGTYSTWQGYLGFANPPGCDTAALEAGDPGDPNVVTDHENLFENQMSYIAGRPDAADAIYFMSFGKFQTTCPAAKCAGATNDLTTFGKIDGQTASQSSIQGTGGGNGVTFPVTRDLYNVYNNSTAVAPATAASQATLNFVGEQGFLCKSETASQTDTITGVPYRGEIESILTSQGFYPIDVGQTAFPEGSLTNPGDITDAGYAANDGTSGANGYCLVHDG
jgi:hypothetical protein